MSLRSSIRKLAWWMVIVLGAVFLLIQFVPYGRSHTNPAVAAEPPWASSRTRELAVRACYSCHSNETDWPWYSSVAPMSWLIQRDVDEGRAALNFSEFDREQDDAEDAADTVADGEMPPTRYVLANPDARLTEPERRALLRGLIATFGDGGGEDGRNGGGSGGEDGRNGGGSGEDGD